MKSLKVEDVLKEIKSKDGGYKRFNKKDFNLLLTALANDETFISKVSTYRRGEVIEKEIIPSKEFRKWCKKLLESAGMDGKEASKVLTSDFVFENTKELYDFFAHALYTYLDNGNKFDFPSKKDFKGTIYLKKVKKSKKVSDMYSPRDRKHIGTFEITKEEHKVLASKSSCPSYLKSKKKIK